MANTKISATIVADSINPQENRITTMELVFPRFILAELNTHRMLSKNSASSRAIPFKKMVEMVQNDPCVPIAWMKEHKGMQGTEYLDEKTLCEFWNGQLTDTDITTIKGTWLEARDRAIENAEYLSKSLVTKQLCNRLLEPFMWHKVLITGTEFSNFFSLRCPQYVFKGMNNGEPFKSWKDVTVAARAHLGDEEFAKFQATDYLYRLQHNKGQAEIHMMALAEAMWDAMNESTPKQSKAGEWHIPYAKTAGLFPARMSNIFPGDNPITQAIKIATAMCARTSYTTVGDEKEVKYENLLELHNELLIRPYTSKKGRVYSADDPIHASPSEHCARAMSDVEYNQDYIRLSGYDKQYGWCRNCRGWIQYRAILEEGRV